MDNFGKIKLVFRTLAFYRWTSIGVFLAALVSSTVFVGALSVGDSVDYSLYRMIEARLGDTEVAMHAGDRFFREELVGELAEGLDTHRAAVLAMRGMAADGTDTRLAGEVNVLGVDESFFQMGNITREIRLREGRVALNTPLAARLGVSSGDDVILRIPKPTMMPRDVAFTPEAELSMAFRLEVSQVLDAGDFGFFGLEAVQKAPLNAYLPREWLAEQLNRSGQANLALLGELYSSIGANNANARMRDIWRLPDAELELVEISDAGLELRSSRVFIDQVLAEAAMKTDEHSVGILTYFVNSLQAGDRSTPYSTVTAMTPTADGDGKGIVDTQMGDKEIVINEWLAADLGIGEGDKVELVYYVVDVDRRLVEDSRRFEVRKVVPIEGLAADKGLMPEFPGLAGVDNCRDWAPGIPVDLGKIREVDEQYWDDYRGAPKAFVTLAAGQEMWANPYGELTAVRFWPEITQETVAESLRSRVNPGEFGLVFRDVREHGLAARDQAMGFGQLFVGFNMFLITAALILVGLVFVFAVESRTGQIGMLKAIGWPGSSVKKLYALEGGLLALAGAALGALAGLGYARLMVWRLSQVFGQAGEHMIIDFDAGWTTILAGGAGTFLMSMGVVWWAVRRKMKDSARELLGGEAGRISIKERAKSGRTGLLAGAICLAVALILLLTIGRGKTGAEAAAVFFGVGSLLLIGGLGLFHALLGNLAFNGKKTMTHLSGFALRGAARRSGRTLAVIALLSAGVFVVIAVGANRQDALADAHRMDSGTGGFALFGRSAISVPYDLSTPEGRESAGLDLGGLQDVKITPIRVREGDDASCFNLNRAQQPRLLGVEHSAFEGRFRFLERVEGRDSAPGWGILEKDFGEGVVPAVGDAATVRWALGKSVGDDIGYTDRRGRNFTVRIAGIINDSVMQGGLIISDHNFRERFEAEGARMFLVDGEDRHVEQLRRRFAESLRDYGLEIFPAGERLAEFAAVENTYISMFQILGGLGLILGSIGLGLVVLRNILDRRGELAMLQAVGYKKRLLKKMVFYEHAGMMLVGLLFGVLVACVAVSPQLLSPAMEVPLFSLFFIVCAIAGSGLVWIWLAVSLSLHGDFYDYLRNE